MNVAKLISFNCKGVSRSKECVRRICNSADVIALQETWLLPHDIPCLGSIDDSFAYTGKSAVDTSAGILRGRPYGGVALLWKKDVFPIATVIECTSVRLCAVKLGINNRSLLVFSVYMPTNSIDNLLEFTETLCEINAIIENNSVESVYMLGDFNAHPGELFYNELSSFCIEQRWSCADIELLPPESYTFVSDAHGSRRWLDHCVLTSAARLSVLNISILYDIYWSDHYPVLMECNLDLVKAKVVSISYSKNKVIWGDRDSSQIKKYINICNSQLKFIDFPEQCSECADRFCDNVNHRVILDKMYNDLVTVLTEASKASKQCCKIHKRKKYVTGWNKHVRDSHVIARRCYIDWLASGKPTSGEKYNDMCNSRIIFKQKLKWCQNNEQQIKMDKIADQHNKKDFKNFWKNTNSLNPKPGHPVSVSGIHEPTEIAEAFRLQLKIDSLSPTDTHKDVKRCKSAESDVAVRFTNKQVKNVIRGMVKGKSPGHDGLSIEHLKYAGAHLPRILTMFFNLCISHSYLPDRLMHTVVIPIIKNRSGDASDISNYRPISLATIVAKVLDSLLDQHLNKHINLHDQQFGFRTGLSTESAIMCLKETVQYYVTRKTPVYACFLDLSRAFDLVSYRKLWEKLEDETSCNQEVVSLLKHWYNNQTNVVKWAGASSAVYRLNCGVRQGGLTSPRLFNLYMNGLIGELNSTGVGCHIDGVCVNNISYADDMVLLSPSMAALKKLVRICEVYAEAHGLKYNSRKSEIMIFKASNKSYATVPVTLSGSELKQVSNFKYLGHWVSEDLKDDKDLERERRALAVRSNMLARRFRRCSDSVKVTLFKAYCQSLYTCSLWVNYTRMTYNALRVQYNNTFRTLLRLPRFCSASGMFADAHTDGFNAIIRKRSASLLHRVRTSTNSVLNVLTDRWDSQLLRHWLSLHTVL